MNQKTATTDTGRWAHWLGLVASSLVTCLLVVVALVAVSTAVVPRLAGGLSLTVLTGSMEPSIKPGDIVVTRGVSPARAAQLTTGDIITFLPYPDDPTLVTHRIIGVVAGQDGKAFVTQGDNNNAPDTWGPVYAYQVRGELLYTVPKLGYLRSWVDGNASWLVAGAACLLLGYSGVTFAWSLRRPEEDGSAPEDGAGQAVAVASPDGPARRAEGVGDAMAA